MSSAYVRGPAKPLEKTSSNKRKRLTQQNPKHTSIYLNMHPPPASQELSDHHARTLEATEDQEAAALLNSMHQLHHVDHPHHSDHLPHGDYHENGHAAADHEVPHPHPRAPARVARENSSSSDASVANYFSGDSDLTAEPIMGFAPDEEGAKSSNSGSSTPYKVPHRDSPSSNHAHVPAGEGQDWSIDRLPQNVQITGSNYKEGAAQSLPMSTSMMQTSTNTASPSRWNSNSASSQQTAAGIPMMRGCHSSKVEGADFGGGSESWLDLRLGFSAKTQPLTAQSINGSLLNSRDEQRKSGESLDGMMELAPAVTLQLLPVSPKVPEINGAYRAGSMLRTFVDDPRSCRQGDFPFMYRPSDLDHCTHARPKLAENHRTTARFAPSDHPQTHVDQSQHSAAAALMQPSDHQRFMMIQSADPAADLQQASRHPSIPPGFSYDQAHGYAGHSNDRRRWLAAETPDMSMMTATAARPAEVFRPTASLGWPTNRSVETNSRPWSANTAYTSTVPMQRAISWQGLLRSMTTDPLLRHPLPELPLCSFDSAPVTEMPGSKYRQMFPAANPGHIRPASHQRLRLSTSRRSAGLWFSLQEAHPYPDESMEDEEEQHNGMQKVYLRIRDGKMQVSVLQSYLVRKLQSSGSYDSHEVEITCRGRTLAPTLTIQHVRDTIWLSKEVEPNDVIGFRCTHQYLSESHTRVMALCYQTHHTQTVTLNLLKT